MNTKIFKNYDDFFERQDKNINGVSEEFAKKFPNYVEMNQTNTKCWNCYNCKNCIECFECQNCAGCKYCTNCTHCNDLVLYKDCNGSQYD